MTALQAFLTTPVLGTSAWLWLVFMAIVIGLLVLDLGVLHRHDREIEMRESLLLYSGYFSVGVLFGAGSGTSWVRSRHWSSTPVSWSNSRCRWTTCSSWR